MLVVILLRLIYGGIGTWVVLAGGPVPLHSAIYPLVEPYLKADSFSVFFINPWFQWDTVSYLKIGIVGYQADSTVAFMPLYPLLIRWTGPLFGGNYLLAALILSSLLCAVSMILMYELFLKTYAPEIALRAVGAFIAFPTAFFLLAGYTEALFMSLVLAFWLLALKRQWLWAGVFAGLATLTRLQGVILGAVLPWMMLLSLEEHQAVSPLEQIRQLINLLRSVRRRKIHSSNFVAWLAPLIPILSALAYQTWLGMSGFGTIQGALQQYWHLETMAPWNGFLLFLRRLPLHHFNYMDYVDLTLLIVILATALIGLRRLDSASSLYVWITIAVLFTRGTPPHLLASYSRYFLALFPLFVLPALLQNKLIRAFLLVTSGSLQILLVSVFLWGSWVA